MNWDEIRKKNSDNPKWVEKLIEKLDVWIEIKENNKLYLDGTFSAEELRMIADAIQKNLN